MKDEAEMSAPMLGSPRNTTDDTALELLRISMDHTNALLAAGCCNIDPELELIEMARLLRVANQKLAESKTEHD